MAHGVRRAQTVKIQQALHGYAEGHRQLAASIQLKPRDAKLMLVLSDLSGPGAQIDNSGYLTGYPLSDSKAYAIARTWPAPEMPRPGCVWTHTLLIDFADIAALGDASPILSLFRRPSGRSTAEYGAALEAPLDQQVTAVPTDAEPYARQLLASLYGRPGDRVIASRPVGVDVDPVVVAMWGQQWPRLRRAFRFCTLASSDRSSEGNVFDLQLLPSLDRSIRTRFPNAVEARDVGIDEIWLNEAVSDLVAPGDGDLRSFLRRIGGDVASGRGAFRALCRLHALIDQFRTEPSAVDAAISLLELELGSVQARAARGMVASAAMAHPQQLDDVATDFLVRHLDLVEPGVVALNGKALGAQVWKHDPTRFVELLEGGDRQRLIAESGIANLDLIELADGLGQTPQLSTAALTLRPELVTLEDFWRHDLVPAALSFATLADKPELRSAAVIAMIAAERDDLAPQALREIGALAMLQLVATKVRTSEDVGKLSSWLRVSLSEPSVVGEFLSQQIGTSWTMLSIIAASMSPDAVPNEYGIDPWLSAVEAARKSERANAPILLSAYLLSRALGWRSRNPGELARLGFEQVHQAARVNKLPDDAWGTLQPRLPWSFNWLEWDRCPRIRAAVADLFVDRDLPLHIFADITADDRLFDALAETVARNDRGRHFLKRVRRWMKDDGQKRFIGRVKTIEHLVK